MAHFYYYLIASLPSLDFEGKPSMSVEDFSVKCEDSLSNNDYHLMRQLLVDVREDIKTTNSLVRKWQIFQHSFRNESAYYRAQRANQNPQEHIRGERIFTPHLAEAIQEAGRESNLLLAEKMLDKIRWQYLDELSQGHYFDLEWLLVYGLKLKILERYQVIYSSKGQEILEEYKSIPERIEI